MNQPKDRIGLVGVITYSFLPLLMVLVRHPKAYLVAPVALMTLLYVVSRFALRDWTLFAPGKWDSTFRVYFGLLCLLLLFATVQIQKNPGPDATTLDWVLSIGLPALTLHRLYIMQLYLRGHQVPDS